MMSKTHISIGIATSLLLLKPTTITDCLSTLIGASVGSIICDIDIRSNSYCRDALNGRLIALGIVVTALLIDFFGRRSLIASVVDPHRIAVVIIGAAILLISCMLGVAVDKHRAFTHSILALVVMSISVFMICPAVSKSFSIGFVSHLALDVLNKKGVRIFYPFGNGFCLKICYANRTANSVLMIVGGILSLVLLIYFILISCGIIPQIF